MASLQHFVARTSASKLGPVPTVAVGTTLETMRATCRSTGCRHLDLGTCYAFGGRVGWMTEVSARAAHAPTLRQVIDLVTRSARLLRVGTVGDPSGLPVEELRRTIRDAASYGLEVLGYTHGWRLPHMAEFRSTLLASVDNLEEADEAIAAGWRPAVLVPPDAPRVLTTPAGHRVVLCAEQAAKRAGGHSVTCNTCRVCVRGHSEAAVGLAYHGKPSWERVRAALGWGESP